MKLTFLTSSILLIAAAVLVPASAQHIHINAGALDENHNGIPDAGEPLYFENGAAYAAGSGFVKELTFQLTGAYAGYFSGNITFTSLAATEELGGPEPGHAALGSFIEMRLESVTGPAGGVFAFWESGAVLPSMSLAVGEVPAAPLQWALTDLGEAPRSAAEDPFGHIHGRQFTASEAGLYTVTFRLVDTSTFGPGGGAIHADGELYSLQFLAVPEPGLPGLLVLAAAVIAWARMGRRR